MAKVPFSKFQAKVNGQISSLSYHNLAGEEIYYEVKHYFPFVEKLELVSRIINNSIDNNGFYNPMRVKYNMVLEIVYAYTNLSFTEKMKEDSFKLYDILVSSGIYEDIIHVILEKDYVEIEEGVWSTINNIYQYRNSVMGVLDAVSTDYSNLNLDATTIKEELSNEDNLRLLRDVVSKLG